jgi:hypothetical protein
MLIRTEKFVDNTDMVEVLNLDPGSYTIVCSTFMHGQKGAFTLRVDATDQPALKQLPPQDAGLLRKGLPECYFTKDFQRLGAPIRPKRLHKLTAIITHYYASADDNRSPVRLSVIVNRGPNERPLCQSGNGDFNDGRASAVRLPELSLWPPKPEEYTDMWLIVERMYARGSNVPEHEGYGISILCDDRVDECVEIGKWRTFDE